MSIVELLLCPDLSGSQWQLGHPKSGLTGVGWAVRPAPVDSGVPDVVADILSQAMAKMGRVAFLADGRRQAGGGDSLYPVKRRRLSQLLSSLRGRTRLALHFTSRAEQLRSSFDDPAYPFDRQGQLYLFLGEGVADLAIDEDRLTNLTADGWMDAAVELRDLGIVAVARPGVDGDLLGFYSPQSHVADYFLQTLVQVASARSIESRMVENDAFALALSAS